MSGKPADGLEAPLDASERAAVGGHAALLRELEGELGKRIVGQHEVIRQVLACLLSEGHGLIVGVPGLAKTLLIRSLAELLSLEFRRIQFTPDLMPSDITGATLIQQGPGGERGVHFLKGPIFANVILADEINRTPPKTQAALMEAMEERQVTTAGRRRPLPRPFLVLATQNPIEQEGTYPLPVSQRDRFQLEIRIDYPSEEEEFRIVVRTTSAYSAELAPRLGVREIESAIRLARRIPVPERLRSYATRIVQRTRPGSGSAAESVRDWIAWGAGPRAVQAVLLGAKALAFLDGREEVTAEDIHAVVHPALRHRLVLTYHAEAEGIRADQVIDRLLETMPDGLYSPRVEHPLPPRGLLRRLLHR